MGNCISRKPKPADLEAAELKYAESTALLATQEQDLLRIKKELEISNTDGRQAIEQTAALRKQAEELEAQCTQAEQ